MVEAKPLEDHELDALWRAGSQDAGREFVRRHFDRLYRFFSAAAPGHADDLAQETFLAFMRRGDPERTPLDIRAYLMGIARNKALMHWRSHARRRDRPVDFELDSIEDMEETPTQIQARSEEQRLLLRALRGIPLETQILLQLFYWEGMTAGQLAAFFTTTDLAIRHRLRRARELLSQRLTTLAHDPDAARTTLDNLDRWVHRLREQAGARREP